MNSKLADAIDALLPQTQCTRCGYPTCRDYAEAIAAGDAEINRCPPGGRAGVRALAALLGREEKPLDPACGTEKPRAAAVIDEARCIGCTLCIQACPVDAIVGAARQMHAVLTAYCTGCELCLPPCPVDCIDLVALDALKAAGHDQAAKLARQSTEEMAAMARLRFARRRLRDRSDVPGRNTGRDLGAEPTPSVREAELIARASNRKREAIEAALQRARALRSRAARSGRPR